MPFVRKTLKKIENPYQFEPIELNETHVNMIYSRCLASEEEIKEKKDLVLAQCLMKKRFVGPDSKLSVFSSKKLKENQKSINYLLGQLKSVKYLTSYSFKMKANGEFWTADNTIANKLTDLGIGINVFEPYTVGLEDVHSLPIQFPIKPTLSPNDPNFPAWWAEHKSEWEEPKKEGNEPSID